MLVYPEQNSEHIQQVDMCLFILQMQTFIDAYEECRVKTSYVVGNSVSSLLSHLSIDILFYLTSDAIDRLCH